MTDETPEGDSSIAEELAEDQEQISISEFFERNRQMLGFDSGARALVTTVKEAVDNSLDATEEARILPEISVEVHESGEYYKLVFTDNGPGITKEQIPKIFGKLLYGSRFDARRQTRGQQGIGISAAVMYAQLTSGKPAKITSQPKGHDTAHYYELVIDTETNEPDIKHEEEVEWDHGHGTRIELEMEGNMRARQQLQDYITYTAVVNPHARLTFTGPETSFEFDRVVDELPRQPDEIKPHPHGIDLGQLQNLIAATESYSISGFLQEEFTRVGQKTADTIVTEFKDRYYGRDAAWSPPDSGVIVTEENEIVSPEVAVTARESIGNEETESEYQVRGLEESISGVVRNKAQQEVSVFVDTVCADVQEANALTQAQISGIVDGAAEAVEDEFDTRFGETVRENAVMATWAAVKQQRQTDLREIVDRATSKRKTDAVVAELAAHLNISIGNFGGDKDRVTETNLRTAVDRASDRVSEREDVSIGETARSNITAEVWKSMCSVPDDPPKLRAVSGARDAEDALHRAMAAVDVHAPPSSCLSPITAENLENGLKDVFDADLYAAATRDAGVHSGSPFIVEAGLAYGGDIESEGQAAVLRFANRVPLVYQRGACAITDVIKGINWRNYFTKTQALKQSGGAGIPTGPLVILVHVASTRVPFTSESKDAVANVPEIEEEIERAVREVARELKSHLSQQASLQKRRRKQDVITEIIPEIADKLTVITGEGGNVDPAESQARIMNNLHVNLSDSSNGETTVHLQNFHGNTNASPVITIRTDMDPGGLEDSSEAVTVAETAKGWEVTWTPTVKTESTSSLELGGEPDTVTVTGIESERVTLSDDSRLELQTQHDDTAESRRSLS